MGKEVSAGVIIYRDTPEGAKFLLLYHGGGYWNFPKGKLEEGERSFKAAIREVKEETGILFKELRFRDYFKAQDTFQFKRGKDRIEKHVSFYLAESKTLRVRLSPREHEGYGWFLYRDAVKLIRHKNLQELFKKAYDTVARPSSTRSRRGEQANDKFSKKGTADNRGHSSRPRHNVQRRRSHNKRPSRGSRRGPSTQTKSTSS